MVGAAGVPPACAACPHSFDGVRLCTIASAGAAIMTIINAETNAAARTLLSLLNLDLLWLLPYDGTYGRQPPLVYQ